LVALGYDTHNTVTASGVLKKKKYSSSLFTYQWVRFICFISGCPPECGTEDKAASQFICIGYTAGLARFNPVSPGHERSGETGAKRANPAV